MHNKFIYITIKTIHQSCICYLMDRARGLNLNNYRIQGYYLRRALVRVCMRELDQDIYKSLEWSSAGLGLGASSGYQVIYILIYIGVYKYIKIHVTLIMKNQIYITIEFKVIIYTFVRVQSGARPGQGLERSLGYQDIYQH